MVSVSEFFMIVYYTSSIIIVIGSLLTLSYWVLNSISNYIDYLQEQQRLREQRQLQHTYTYVPTTIPNEELYPV